MTVNYSFQNVDCEKGKGGKGFSLPSLPLKKVNAG
jgi:hypothetical protein